MDSPIPDTPTIAAAESEAVLREQAEAAAEERFRAVRTRLEATGNPADVTRSPEFVQWMRSREETDQAWGRWAMAVDRQRAPGAAGA